MPRKRTARQPDSSECWTCKVPQHEKPLLKIHGLRYCESCAIKKCGGLSKLMLQLL